jgi:hypothetical protein
MIEQQAEREEALVDDGTTTAEDDNDDDEDAEIWQWSWHHPKLAQFPDVASTVGSIELITSNHPGLLVKTPDHRIAKGNKNDETDVESSTDRVAWKFFGLDNNSRSIRLVRLDTIGRMISGRIQSGKIEIVCSAIIENARTRRKRRLTPSRSPSCSTQAVNTILFLPAGCEYGGCNPTGRRLRICTKYTTIVPYHPTHHIWSKPSRNVPSLPTGHH